MKTLNILLIEDNTSDVRLIQEMLKEISHFKYNFISAVTLKDGCEQIQKNNTDIILLDLNLPDSSGQQTFQKVIDCSKEIPVLLITGNEDEELSLKLIKEGAQDYITKQSLNPVLLGKSILYSIERKQAEKDLRESEFRFRSFVENANDIIYTLTPKGIFIYSSPNWTDILGYEVSESIGKSFESFVHPEDILKFRSFLEWVVITGKKQSGLDYRIQHKKGNWLWHTTNASAIRNSDGKVISFLGIAHDITEGKRLQKVLQDSQENFKSIYEGSNDAIMLLTEKGFFDCNPKTLELFGINSKKEFVKLHPAELSPTVQADGRISLKAADDNIRKAYQQGINRFDWIHRRSNGEDFPAEVILSAFNFGGEQVLQATVRDIGERKRAETELRFHSEVLQNLYEGVNMIRPSDGMIIYTNQRFNQMFGYNTGELIDKHVSILNAPGAISPELMADKIMSHLTQSSYWSGEVYSIRKDGKTFWTRANVSSFKHNQFGEVFLTVQEDISERKQAVESLSKSEEHFRSLFEKSFNAIFLVDLKTGKYLNANKAAEELTGRTIEDLRNHTFISITSAGGEDRLKLIQATNKPISIGEIQYIRPDGSKRDALISNTRISDDLAYGIAIDITERKKAEESLLFKTTLLEAQSEISIDGILAINTEGKVILFNKRFGEIFNIPPDILDKKEDKELLSYAMKQLKYPVEFGNKVAYLYEHHDEKSRDEIEFADGRFYDRYSSPMINSDRKYLGRIWFFRDITERKQTEVQIIHLNADLEQKVKDRTAKLESANKELESFTYSVSHDLRRPLRHIDGYIDLLHKESVNNLSPKALDYINIISASATNMGMLIDELLAFSKIARAEINKSMFSMEQMVKDVITGFKIEETGRDVQWKIGHLPEINGDLYMLKQAFINLISNAVKYTSKTKTAHIEIDSYKNSDNVNVFFIKDNGAGFSMKYVDKLFGIFSRLHMDEDFQGIGIGLANVQKIVEKHGGRIWAEGEEGKGATFYFTIP